MNYIFAIFAYLFILVLVGFYKARSVKNSDDFMVAGRTLPWYVLVGTLLATWMGSGSLFSGAGLGYRNGLASLWSSGGAWLGIALIYFIANRIRNFGKVTVPDIFEIRYGKSAALLATITTVIAYTTIVSYQFRGGGKVLNLVSDGYLSIENGIIITAVFAIFYTVVAGMFSVVYTDVVNGILMVIGTVGALFFLIDKVGGISEIISIADMNDKWSLFGNWHHERVDDISGPIIAISFFVPTMLLLMGDANMYQRIFSARDEGSARKAVFFWIFGVIILESVIAMLGLTGFVAITKGIIPDLVFNAQSQIENKDLLSMLQAKQSASEGIIPAISRYAGLPTFLGLLLASTMMAIIVSTADSFLLIPSTNLTKDIYIKYINPDASEKKILFVSRGLVLFLGIVAYLLVSQFKTILGAAFTAYNIYGTALTPSLLAAFLWKRATRQGAIVSILTGTLITIIWTFFLPSWDGYQYLNPFLKELTYPASILSILALIVVSMATPKPNKENLEPFFRS